jgi:hypothetical protein
MRNPPLSRLVANESSFGLSFEKLKFSILSAVSGLSVTWPPSAKRICAWLSRSVLMVSPLPTSALGDNTRVVPSGFFADSVPATWVTVPVLAKAHNGPPASAATAAIANM